MQRFRVNLKTLFFGHAAKKLIIGGFVYKKPQTLRILIAIVLPYYMIEGIPAQN